jgi:EF hand domain-containing protein
MPFPAMIAAALMFAAAEEDSPVIVKGFPWAPFVSPMGEPFRPPSSGEAPIERWFTGADRNRDGMLTADEMQADADRFFARLDSNRDGQIDPDEIKTYEWEIAPEIQVNSDWRRRRGEAVPEPRPNKDFAFGDGPAKRPHDGYDGYQINGLQGAARYGILNIPQPVASADADFNRAITLAEFRQAAQIRFKLLDANGQGRLTLPELEARLPIRPKGKRPKPRKDEVDTRVGLPLPEGD